MSVKVAVGVFCWKISDLVLYFNERILHITLIRPSLLPFKSSHQDFSGWICNPNLFKLRRRASFMPLVLVTDNHIPAGFNNEL